MKKNLCALVLASFQLLRLQAFAQGSLTPPAGPAPTMKSLDQIASTGTAINDTNTPGDSTDTYIISSPGSYYLTGNLNGTPGKNGILISSDDVTVELNGFVVACGVAGQSSVSGVIDSGSHRNLAIRNGTIRGWGIGNVNLNSNNVELRNLRLTSGQSDGTFATGDGVSARSASKLLIIDCLASNNAGDGFATGINASGINCSATGSVLSGFSGSGTTLSHCSADTNGIGFFIFGAGNLSHCSAVSASGQSTGIILGPDSVAPDCVASGNGGDGFSLNGRNHLTHCVANGNGQGINAGTGSTVTACTASSNTGNGIIFTSDCVITNNNANLNGGNGFESSGSLNRIDSNAATSNTGHGFVWGNDYLVRNTAFANTGGDYTPTPGTGNSGPRQAASSATNPFANF